ncbi:AraC family transcriptional regulator [uncultured Flavobacterium sp.]|uniref:helix-turn-helix domain-containing protein n=1 Tax=uncultured Flavobacterium sp. TaxID=165435 RepID=UPI0025F18FB0|nr:AraC family transcriptional regulator [uncultured Flavobacterium sp.]
MERQKPEYRIKELHVYYLKEINSIRRLNALLKPSRFSMLLVNSGAVDFQVKDKIVCVPADCLYLIHAHATATKLTGRISVCLVSCSSTFALASAISRFGTGQIDNVLTSRGTMLCLNRADFNQILVIIALLKQKISIEKEMIVHSELVVLCFNLLLYEFGALQCTYGVGHKAHRSRNEKLVANFIVLVRQHCRQQHSARFYADLLYVTTGHLSKAVRVVMGVSAKNFIEIALLSEAYVLLANENLTIAEISETLNFSNLSNFSSFFKRHSKLSPRQHRLTLGQSEPENQ